jgi:predicted MPP superfamily phosphohydrolase
MNPETLAAYFQSVADALPAWVLLLGASVGHGYLFIVALNVFYAWPLPHELMKYTRKVDLLIVMSGPLLFAVALDLFDTQRLSWQAGHWRAYLSGYAVICWIVGFCIAPVCEIFYLLRQTAPQLVKETTETVDVAKELGYPPCGHGKDAKACSLPLNQCFQVEFTEKTLVLPQIPDAWDGLTILHLTDLHLCGTPDRAFFHYVMERSMKAGTPDLLLLTGDVVDSEWHHRWIVPVLGKLRWNIGAYAILGNHDSWRDVTLIRRRLRRVGMTVLGGSSLTPNPSPSGRGGIGWQQIDVRGQPMVVIGHEGPWFTPVPDLAKCPDGIFRLCLSHTPDNIAWARANHIDLMLAGHVHGGQIRLPVLGSVFVPSRYSRKYDCGTFYVAPTVMHVGRGLSGQHPLRFFCKPEVTRIVLRKEPRTK